MRLFFKINNNWVEPELDRTSNELSLDFHYGNFENPADYTGEYAFDFIIPRTQNNDKLFNQYFRMDSVVNPESDYDPSVKLPYQIISDKGNVISTGTGYIQKIDKKNYRAYLSGALHTIFTKALNSGWNTTKAEEDSEYYLMNDYISYKDGQYNHPPLINALTVYLNWGNNNPTFDYHVSETTRDNSGTTGEDAKQSVLCADTICWIPTHQGAMEGINTDKWIAYQGRATSGQQQLFPMWSYYSSGISGTFPLGEDPTEYQMAEFRSYNQQPAIYVNKIWQWYRDIFPEMTGYTLELDEGWFSQNNPYLRYVLYTLPKLKRNYVLSGDDVTEDEQNISPQCQLPTSTSSQRVPGINNVNVTNTFTFPTGFRGGDFKVEWFPWINSNTAILGFWNWYDQCFRVTITIKDSGGNIRWQRRYGVACCPWGIGDAGAAVGPSNDVKNWMNNTSNCDEWTYMRYALDWSTSTCYYMQYVFASEVGEGFPFNFTCMCEEGDYMEVKTEIHSVNNKYPFTSSWRSASDHQSTYPNGYYYMTPTWLQTQVHAFCVSQNFEIRSNSPVTLPRLFNAESPFSVLLKYSKMMNLVWVVDDENKKVKVYERAQHFYDCMSNWTTLPQTGSPKVPITGILDLTENVNYSKDVVMTPIDWNDKYIYMNFKETENDYLAEYNKKWKRTYGSKMLESVNKRTSTTKNMFNNSDNDTIYEAADITPYYIPIGTCYENAPMAYKADKLLLNSKEGNTKTADNHGQFVFRGPNQSWSSRMYENFRPSVGVLISDDDRIEINEQKYYYHGVKLPQDYQIVTKPNFSPLRVSSQTNISLWFAFPREAYAPINYAQNTTTIYDKWSSYLQEIYNVNNKTVELYIHLTDVMYKRLKLNPLCQIDNCVYIMMSIEGFNENSEWCKCTLKQFSSIENLISGADDRDSQYDSERIWLFDNDEYTPIAFDDDVTLLIGDGRPFQPIEPVVPVIIDPDPVPVVPVRPNPIWIIPEDQSPTLPIEEVRRTDL